MSMKGPWGHIVDDGSLTENLPFASIKLAFSASGDDTSKAVNSTLVRPQRSPRRSLHSGIV